MGKIVHLSPPRGFWICPTIVWPGSLSLHDDLIRWSAQEFDDQIRFISARISNHAASMCGARAVNAEQLSMLGEPRLWQAPQGLARHHELVKEALARQRTVKIRLVIPCPGSLSSRRCASVGFSRRSSALLRGISGPSLKSRAPWANCGLSEDAGSSRSAKWRGIESRRDVIIVRQEKLRGMQRVCVHVRVP